MLDVHVCVAVYVGVYGSVWGYFFWLSVQVCACISVLVCVGVCVCKLQTNKWSLTGKPARQTAPATTVDLI